MKPSLFGREPAAWVSLVEAGLAALVAVGVLPLSAVQVGLVVAAVAAVLGVYTAYRTADTMLGVVVGLTKAVIALAIGFGAGLSPEMSATLIAFVTVAVGFVHRSSTSPLPAGTFAERTA